MRIVYGRVPRLAPSPSWRVVVRLQRMCMAFVPTRVLWLPLLACCMCALRRLAIWDGMLQGNACTRYAAQFLTDWYARPIHKHSFWADGYVRPIRVHDLFIATARRCRPGSGSSP